MDAENRNIAPFGGEMYYPDDRLYRYWTDSGRSSLRLAVDRLRDRRFAIPDYLCSVVVDVLQESGVAFTPYRVKADLSIDYATLDRDAEVLYTIDYFGKPAGVERALVSPTVIVLADAVFTPPSQRDEAEGEWIWFNSYRKFSPLCDGSLIVSTLELDSGKISPEPAPFVERKHRAKIAKAARRESESEYLQLFEEGERLLDEQMAVHSISRRSQTMLLDFHEGLSCEMTARQRNYDFLRDRLGRWAIDLGNRFKTFFVMRVDGRDALREHLRAKGIYLPAHWHDRHGLGNPLSKQVISIPVDSRYGARELDRVASRILTFLGEG